MSDSTSDPLMDAFPPEAEVPPNGTPYSASVERLLAIGEPPPEGLDYLAMAFSDEDIPELIRLALAPTPSPDDWDGPASWGSVHAWRVLGALKAEIAVEPLLTLWDDADDDIAHEEVPTVIGQIGPSALPILATYLADASRTSFSRSLAAAALVEVARQHPDSRTHVVEILTSELRKFEVNDRELNAFLVAELMSVGATESLDVVEAAYQANRVEWSLVGDWEDAQIAFGVLDQRLTPQPRYNFFPGNRIFSDGERDGFDAELRKATASKKPSPTKAKAKRKAAKASKKRNRK